MAAAILRFENSRVPGPDSLRVSRLPAADKGGKWEVCGICDGIEPVSYTHLDVYKRQNIYKPPFSCFSVTTGLAVQPTERD